MIIRNTLASRRCENDVSNTRAVGPVHQFCTER